MPDVIFSHPRANPQQLVVQTGADMISWGYGLNTQTYPTYGGEVVQILSAYIDDLNIQGTARSYASMESIYRWFLQYIQLASQVGGFTEIPVDFVYPERGWTLKVQPKGLPGFRLGTEVVAPSWQIQCQVMEQDQALSASVKDYVVSEGVDEFQRLNAGISFDEYNPFSRFDIKKDFDKTTTKEAIDKVGDFYGKFLPAYLDGNFDLSWGDLDKGSGPLMAGRPDQTTKSKTGTPVGGPRA